MLLYFTSIVTQTLGFCETGIPQKPDGYGAAEAEGAQERDQGIARGRGRPPHFVKRFLKSEGIIFLVGDAVPKPLGFGALWQTVLVLRATGLRCAPGGG